MNPDVTQVGVGMLVGLIFGIALGMAWGHSMASKRLDQILALTEGITSSIEAEKKFAAALRPKLVDETSKVVADMRGTGEGFPELYAKAFADVFPNCYLAAQAELTNEEYALLDPREQISAKMFEELFLPVLYRYENLGLV